MISREEHLAWCKARALEYVHEGDLADAVASMISDMGKHPETEVSFVLVQLGMLYVTQHDDDAVRRWIEGFR
jgi:hypothetical protein